jgi:hypothetical protein
VKAFFPRKLFDWNPIILLSIYLTMTRENREDITKEKLVQITAELLKTDVDLGFLRELKRGDLEKLVASIRDRTDQLAK